MIGYRERERRSWRVSRMPGFLVTEAVRDPEVAKDLLGRAELRFAIWLAPTAVVLVIAGSVNTLLGAGDGVEAIFHLIALAIGFVSFRYLNRKLVERCGPIRNRKDENRAPIMRNLAVVGVVIFLTLQVDLRAGLPFKLWEFGGGALFVLVWLRLGRADRYHLLVGVAMIVVMVVASLIGSEVEGTESSESYARLLPLVWAVGVATAGMLDHLMLLDARDVVTAVEAEGQG